MKTGLFSVSYAGLWGQERLCRPDFIGKVGQLGFDGIPLMAKRPYLSPLDFGKGEIASIHQALDEKAHGFVDFMNSFDSRNS